MGIELPESPRADSNPATVRSRLASLSSLCRELAAAGAVRASPVSGVRRPRPGVGGGGATVLTAAQARRLLEARDGFTPKGLRDRAILSGLLRQGLKSGKACGLRVGDAAGDVLNGVLPASSGFRRRNRCWTPGS